MRTLKLNTKAASGISRGELGGIMRLRLGLLTVIVLFATGFDAELCPAQTQAEASLQIPNPRYVTISESIVVPVPVDKVWARVGSFCDITEWMNSPEWEDCRYLQGDGSPGTVRSIVNEVLVGQTRYSYTNAQPASKGHAI